ncbi:MAG: efflux RND transporter periplasmic adaptor subunit [Bryobacteraceae bacterium]
MRSNLRAVVPVALLLLIAAGCGKKDAGKVEAAKAPEIPEIRVQAAKSKMVDRTILVTGSLNADEKVNISPEVQGRVLVIRKDFGQPVAKGEVLVEMDKREYQIQVERAKAGLSQALARLGLTLGQENTQPTSTPAVRQAQAQLDDAKSKFESAARLVKTGDISQEHYVELEKAYRARQAAVEQSKDEVRTQWASMESLKAEVDMAQKKLHDTVLYAPFDGIVGEKMISAGQFVKENTPILTVVKTNPLRLRMEVPEPATGAVKIGTLLTFTTDAVPGAEFSAVVRQMDPSLDAKARSLTAEARLVTNDPRLRPGMFVQVKLVTARDTQVVVVPREAVYSVAGLTKVFVIRNGKAVECKVPPSENVGGWVEVPSDQVKPGDLVAVEKVPTLVDGTEVKAKS